jgi:hypothetical protein
MLEQISNKAGVLVNWVSEMKTISENPYTNGLNIERMLQDLQGFAEDLVKDIAAVQAQLDEAEAPLKEESSEAKSASAKK